MSSGGHPILSLLEQGIGRIAGSSPLFKSVQKQYSKPTKMSEEKRSIPTVSVAMIARNEEKNLPRTLEGVRWVDEVVVVDSGSSDRTPEIAQAFGAG